jgi:hypothetical protein
MWKSRRLTTLWAFTACYRDSFTFTIIIIIMIIIIIIIIIIITIFTAIPIFPLLFKKDEHYDSSVRHVLSVIISL